MLIIYKAVNFKTNGFFNESIQLYNTVHSIFHEQFSIKYRCVATFEISERQWKLNWFGSSCHVEQQTVTDVQEKHYLSSWSNTP